MRGRLLGLLLLSAWSFGENSSHAMDELRPLYRGSRATAMGNAFVAVADDEQAIFINPAGLGGNDRQRIQYAAFDIEISRDSITTFTSDVSKFNNFSGDTLNALIGKNVFAHLQFAPTFLLSNLGIALLSDTQVAVLGKNKALPQMTIGYQFTNGFQVAYGYSTSRRNKGKNDLRVGIAGKMLWRRGGYHTLPLSALVNVSKTTLTDITGSYGRGFGVDLGTQYVRKVNRFVSLSGGLAFTDIGDVAFTSTADPIKSNLSAGLAATLDLPQIDVTLVYDRKHLLTDTDPRKKNHIGLEVSFPIVSVLGGFDQGYLTYGAIVNLWLLKVSAVSYAEELGAHLNQDPERRYLLKIALGL